MQLREKIGVKLKDIRQKSGYTIQELSQKSTVSSNMISRIERGLTVPSVEILVRLSEVFDRSISFFVDENHSETNAVLTRNGDGIPLFFFEEKHRIDGIGTGLRDPSFSVFIDTIQPDCSSGEGVMVHTGDEYAQILSGAIDFFVDGVHYNLTEGDSLFFKATQPHRWANASTGVTKVLWVVSPPPQLVNGESQLTL